MKKTIVAIFLVIASTSLPAETSQSLDVLRDKIESYLLNALTEHAEGRVQVSASKIDPRLMLKPCADDKLELFNPYETSLLNTSTMGIKCVEETNPWTVYVPVKITVFRQVMLSKHALIRGTRITEQDVYLAEMDVQKLKQGYFSNASELTGKVSKRDILPNNPLSPYDIEQAKLIHKGDQVVILATSGSLSVSMEGIALSDGVLGEAVKIKNKSSKRIIEAQVAGKKKVTVTL